MCGLAGIITPGDEDESQRFIADAVAAHDCRGPDHRAIVPLPGDLLLSHNRLSIIDLSSEANQPLWDADERRCIVLNGEIYNYVELRNELAGIGYRFRTSSDTEVLLTAFNVWGDAALDRLKGMFAFVVYEPGIGRMWLARDRFGVKPLYYRLDRDRFLFSSTPGPVARAHGCEPNLDFVARGLRYWLYETDDAASQYAGVLALRAGHLMTVDRSPSGTVSIREQRYYDFGERVKRIRNEVGAMGDADLIGRLTERLETAVDLRLRSDVPVGVSLSGGLDSSSILALACERAPDITTFTFGDPDDSSTEGPAVREITRFVGASAQYVWPSVAELIEAYDRTLDAQDAPFNDVSVAAQFLVFQAARRAGVKVMLGGQGADEMLMGYRKYQLLAIRDAVRAADVRTILRQTGAAALMAWSELGQSSLYLRQLRRYFSARGLRSAVLIDAEPHDLGSTMTARARQVADVVVTSLPTLLRYEDRNSMGNSVESRLPFMDHELAELSVAMPTRAKLHNGYGKWALRAAMREHLPPATALARRKVGFLVQESWLREGLGDHLRARLRSYPWILSRMLPAGTDLDVAFSDRRLARSGTAFADATALIWLGQTT
jgi:asparagine synthase (glutamine-hydrolysing)